MNEVKKSWCDRRGYGQGEMETGAAFYHHSNNPKKVYQPKEGKNKIPDHWAFLRRSNVCLSKYVKTQTLLWDAAQLSVSPAQLLFIQQRAQYDFFWTEFLTLIFLDLFKSNTLQTL